MNREPGSAESRQMNLLNSFRRSGGEMVVAAAVRPALTVSSGIPDEGLWRSGSALPWHGRGRGFNSRQLHHMVTNKGGTAGINPPLDRADFLLKGRSDACVCLQSGGN